MQAADTPRCRSDLRQTLQADGGRTYLLIEDPVSGRFFRLREIEGFILQQLNGATPLEQVHAAVLREFSGVHLTLETLIAFVERLAGLGLLEGTAVRPGLLRRTERLLTVRVPLIDGRRLFAALLPFARWAYRPLPLALAALLVSFALADWVTHRSEWFEWSERGIANQILFFYLGFTLISIFHEVGHGLTCRYFGAEARDLGFLLIYGIPAFYCNVTASYSLASRRERILVGLAGLGWQFVVGALAYLLWRMIEPTTLAARLLHAMVGFCGVVAFVNLIPFIRLDGYYVLTDLLNLPNLRRRSLAYLSGRARQLFLGAPPPTVGTTPAERRILFWFGIGSLGFSTVLLTLVAIRALGWLTTHLGGWGAGLWLALVGTILVGRLRRALSARRRGGAVPSGPAMGRSGMLKPLFRRIAVYVVLASLLFTLALAHWPLTVGCPVDLEATQRVAVRPRTAGLLAEFRFRSGDQVSAGTVLGSLDTLDLVQQRQQIQAQLDAARIEAEIIARSVPVIAAEQERGVLAAVADVELAQDDLATRQDVYPARRAEAERHVQEARAALDASEQIADRLRADERAMLAGRLPPQIQAIEDRLRRVQAEIDFARREVNRVEYLVSEGAVERRRLEVATTALDTLQQEAASLRSQIEAERKRLIEQREDAEAQVRLRRAAYEAALEAQRRVEAETQPETVARAAQRVRTRRAALDQARALRQAATVRQMETRVKAMDARRAAAEIARLDEKIRQAQIVAPVAGIISTPRVEERIGRHFDEGDEICWIDLTESLHARLWVDEKEIGEVHAGLPVRMRIGAYSERWYQGTITWVAPRAVPYRGRMAYEARVALSNPTGELRPGMSGYAKVICGPRPLYEVLFRRLVRWFRTEVWSWF